MRSRPRFVRFLLSLWIALGTVFLLTHQLPSQTSTPVPVAVTGNFVDASGTAYANAMLRWTLMNCAGGAPRVFGQATVITGQHITTVAQDGSVSDTIWSNDVINCSGITGQSRWKMQLVVGNVPQGPGVCLNILEAQPVNLNTATACPNYNPPTPPGTANDGTYNNLQVLGTEHVYGNLQVDGSVNVGATGTYNVTAYGAKGDWNSIVGASMTAGSNLLTDTSGANRFTQGMIGKRISVIGAGNLKSPSNYLLTTITGVLSTSQILLATPALNTVSGGSVYVNWGTDNTAAINNAIAAACANATPTGVDARVYFPAGKYLTSGGHVVPRSCSGLTINGDNRYGSAIVLDTSSSSDALYLNSVGGPPTQLENFAVIAGTGGNFTQVGVNIGGGQPNGVFLHSMWLSSFYKNVYADYGTDISLDDIVSELGTFNYYFNRTQVRIEGSISYQANDTGYVFATPFPTSGTGHPYSVQVSNSYDTESLNTCMMMNGTTDWMVMNFTCQTQNNQQPNIGLYLTGSTTRGTFIGKILHTKTYGIKADGGVQDIKITAEIDGVGNFSTFPATAVYGAYFPQGTNLIHFMGGSISNIAGTCLSDGAGGTIIGTRLTDCALANSSTQGLYSLELALGNGNTTDRTFVTNVYAVNNGGPRGTGLRITGGNNHIISSNLFTGFVTTLDNQPGGTGRQFILNQGFPNNVALDGLAVQGNLPVSGSLVFGGSALWTSGSGAPSGSCATGSMYTRLDGGTSTTLYVCQAGAWVAK